MTRRTLVSAAACVLWSAALTNISAQTIRGVLHNQTSGTPVTAGFVVLLDEDSLEVQRSPVDASGRFTFGTDCPGRYALKSQVIGLMSTVSPYLELAAGQVLEYDFSVPALPVQLGALVVREERVCRSRTETGLAATTLWNEAQKALSAVLWTERQGLHRHRLERYERLLEPVTLRETEEGRRWTQEGVYRGSPFGSAPAAALADHGYITDAGNNEWIYDGPDAQVLLSDEFANTHCFSARHVDGHNSDGHDMIGLAFEPTADRDKPDVAGVLWLDKQTAELRFVEFRYTDAPWEIEVNDVGGRIEFEQLPTGAWIVNRWFIRMPIIALRPIQTVRIGRQPLDQYYLAAIRETGGWVAAVTTDDLQPVARSQTALSTHDMPTPADSKSRALSPTDQHSGFRIGLNVNLLNTGGDVADFGSAPAFHGTVRYSTSIGLQLGGGAQFSRHGMTNVRHGYSLFQLFAEPRFEINGLTRHLSPFLGARVGFAWESVADRGATFNSTGQAYGGVTGVQVRLDSRVFLDAGISVGIIEFGDFSATTDRRWEECVSEQGSMGSSMPATVTLCSPPAFWTGPQLTPGTGITGTGDLPRITYVNTAREDKWKALWVGVEFMLGGW